jgi:deoxyribodipyrimidine photo-lyase
MERINLFWFRRDLRLDDNAGLYHALKQGVPVLPIFIFDTYILNDLKDKQDKRVDFIHRALVRIQEQLVALGSTLHVLHGTPEACFQKLLHEYEIAAVYTNHDYEPYATKRDGEIASLLASKGIAFHSFKDQVIFEKDEVLKANGEPYTVYTPYSKRWKEKLNDFYLKPYPTHQYYQHFIRHAAHELPSLHEIGFEPTDLQAPEATLDEIIARHYDQTRNFPAIHGTTRLSVHLRFGTISIRKLAAQAKALNETLLNELIWREFYQMILWHFPQVLHQSFKKEYDTIEWRNDEQEFERWCKGMTGYPIVDAGMRELNATGYMHNRVRMITASFLCKDLLIDWRWGEAYFASKLLDYDLAANNGSWQWCAGSGCDAAPYFRIFNPSMQTEKFDHDLQYVRRWVPELDELSYPTPMVDHNMARDRCLAAYKHVLKS